jgi:hypothetical protein
MKNLSLLLTLLCLWGCRSPKDPSQTIIRISPSAEMQAKITTITTQVIALPSNEVIVEETPEPAKWPVKRTFVAETASASHEFLFLFVGLDENNEPVAKVDVRAEIVEGASRYLYILLSDRCAVANCVDEVCKPNGVAAALRTSPAQAQALEWTCGDALTQPPPTAGPGDMQSSGGDPDGGRSNTPTGQSQTMTGGMAGAGGGSTPAANGGNGAPDSGTVATPATDGACLNVSCGKGFCSLNAAKDSGYECVCNTGFVPDEAGSSCIPRNDCVQKDNGGCEDLCVPNEVGEAQCACEGPNRWLKGDRKQCAELKPEREEELSTSGGSVRRTRPQVAFDEMGNGIVAWTETSAENRHTLWSARYRADTKVWEKPTAPWQPYAPEAADLHLALDANGGGLLVWTATVNGRRQLYGTRYRDNAFSAVRVQEVDSTSDGDALMPSLAVDPLGDGLVAWTDTNLPKGTLRVARYNVSSDAFSPMPMAMTTPSGDNLVFSSSVAVNSMSNGLVAWTAVPVEMVGDAGPLPSFDQAKLFGMLIGSGSGQPGESFGENPKLSSNPDVVLGPQGNGMAVWVQGPDNTALSVVAKPYVPDADWTNQPLQTLSERGDRFSLPRVAIGADGTSFAAWRESTQPAGGDAAPEIGPRLMFGAMRVGDTFAAARELGLPSDLVTWSDVDLAALTPESLVTLFEFVQPSWAVAVGPQQTGFLAGTAYDSSVTPFTRQLWFQRVSADNEPTEVMVFTASDSVPSRPSPLKLGLNANGDGALVWDRQENGQFRVYANVID